MQDRIHVCVFNNEPASENALRDAFGSLTDVDVVGAAASWEVLCGVLERGGTSAVAVNLDEDVEFGMSLVQHIVQRFPTVAVIGISRRADPTTIIRAMRAGCAQFVCAPIDVEDLGRAIDRIRQTRLSANTQKSHRICVVGSAGGAGATTIACNLAMELAHLADRRVGLVDLNLEYGDVACALDCEPKYSVADLCRGSTVDPTIVQSAMHNLPSNVSILARPEDIGQAASVTAEGVEQALSVMAGLYPFVVIDLPRSVHPVSAAALHGTDVVLIVTQLNVPGIRNATRVYNTLMSLGAPESCVEIVLNRCKAEFERITPDDVEKHFRRPVFAMIPNDYRRVMTSHEFGQPILIEAPSSSARLAIYEMAKKLAAVPGTADDKRGARSGLFRRFLARK